MVFIFVYFIKVYVIKITLIIVTIGIHICSRSVFNRIKFTSEVWIDKILNLLCISVINLLVGLILINSENSYMSFVGLINVAIWAINLLPIYPFDGKDIVEVLIDKIYISVLSKKCSSSWSVEKMNVKEKILFSINNLTIIILLVLGVLQVLLYSGNFSIIIFCVMLKEFGKLEIDNSKIIS